MESQGYYINHSGGGEDYCDMTRPLQVNCTGYAHLAKPFITLTKRRDYYLQVMNVGSLVTGMNGEETLSAGQFIVRTPDQLYRYELTEEREMGYYWVHFTGSYVSELLTSCGIALDCVYTLSSETLPSREFGMLFREFMLRRSGFVEMAASLLTSILVRLGRGVRGENAGVLRHRLEKSVEYIHHHYTEELRVTDLAELEHLCESRYRELFREAFGCPPTEYIIGLRTAHAEDLLTTTDLSVTEVAELCGYGDVLYFCRLFHRKIGMSPGMFRRNHH